MIHAISKATDRGRRGYSRYAHLYEEVCTLLKERHRWDEIVEILSAKEGVKIARTTLYKMWDARRSGGVKLPVKLEPEVHPQKARGVKVKAQVAAVKSELPDEWKPRRAIEYGEEAGAREMKKAEVKKKEPSPWDQINPNDFIQ